MKIVHVIHTYPPFSRAGSENYVEALAQEQARRHEVRIFHRVEQPELPEFEVSEAEVAGIPVTRVNRTFHHVTDFQETYRSDGVALAFGAFLDRHRPDVVHFHHVSCLSTTCVHEAKRRGIAVVYTLHDFWLICPRGQRLRRDLSLCERHVDADCVRCMAHQLRIRGGHPRALSLWRRAAVLAKLPLPRPWYRYLASRPFAREAAAVAQIRARNEHVLETCALVDRFVAPSQFLKERYVDFGVSPERITVSDYGFDLERSRRGVRGGEGEGRPVRFVYLGTWIPSKGVHVLIEAFRGIDPERAVLDVYGYAVPFDGVEGYEERVRKLAAAAPAVRMREAYQPEHLNEILADADALVVPSIWYENSPLTIHEAFLAGIPVITSDHGGMRELVQDGVSGLTFEAGSVPALRTALARLIDDPELRASLRSALPKVKGIRENVSELDALYARVGAVPASRSGASVS